MSYLVDTNVVSELLRSEPNRAVIEWFQKVPTESLYLSVLTIGEIRNGIERLGASKKRSRIVMWLEQELPAWFEDRILNINTEIAEKWGFILARSKEKIPAIDSLLAATALTYNLKIVTRNTKDFRAFADLEIFNPWD